MRTNVTNGASSKTLKRTADNVYEKPQDSIYFHESFVEKKQKADEVNSESEPEITFGDESDDEPGNALNINPQSETELNHGYEADNEPFSDELRPRCEYYCRFNNTSAFANDIKYAHVYTRSDGARYTQGQKSKDESGVKFTPVPFTNPNNKKSSNLRSAHTGGFASPYTLTKYASNIKLEQHKFNMEIEDSKLYDELLTYKLGLCDYIASEFIKEIPHADLGGSRNARQTQNEDQGVYVSNDYPCVLVKFTPRIDNKNVSKGTTTTFYKRYNHMLMAYFIAIVDYNANTAGIEIEMLGRSSFGHNNPSIAVTETSFRINIGLIPKGYADIIVKSLVQLYNLFRLLEDNATNHLRMDDSLKIKLDSGREVGFEGKKLEETYWASLWIKGSHGKLGRNMIGELLERERDRSELLANFVLTAISENSETFFTDPFVAEAPLGKMFKLIKYTPSGSAAVKNTWSNSYKASELESSDFKKNDNLKNGIYRTADYKYFQVIETRIPKMRELKLKTSPQGMCAYKTGQKLSHKDCTELFAGYIYPQPFTISVDSKEELKKAEFFKFPGSSSDKKVNDDGEFYAIIKKLCNGLDVDLPEDSKVRDVYKFLEAAHINFITNKRTREYTGEVTKWGSDSETEELDFISAKSLYAKKVIVANGMLAINLAYYAARVAFADWNPARQKKGFEKILESVQLSINCENNYFETEECLKAAINPPTFVKGEKKADVLFFDLNSFNAGFIAQNVDLNKKLDETKPKVVVLDHTSSTTEKVQKVVRIIFENHENIKLILLVTSGLKNEQGGADNNPYGKLTILSLSNKGKKDTSLTNIIYNKITALSSGNILDKVLLPAAAHAIRHSYKDRGFATRARQMIPPSNVVLQQIYI